MQLIRSLFIFLIGLGLIAPVGVTLTTGSRSTLSGVTKKTSLVPFSLSTVMDGSFQSSFEKRFSRWLSLFGTLVKTDNQLSLWLLQQVSSNPKSRVVMGRDGHLIERSYLPAFNRIGVPKRSNLITVANQIVTLRDLLKSRNKAFVFLISTNKPNFYPTLVPPWYQVSGAKSKPSSYDIFLELLRARGLEPLDSRALLHAAEAQSSVAMFAPTGTHWNGYGACLVSAEIGEQARAQLNRPISRLTCSVVGVDGPPTTQDLDLLQITNLLFPHSLVKQVPRTSFKFTPSDATGDKPRLLMIGTSFCWELLQVLQRNPIFSDLEFLYYFQRQVLSRGGKQRPISKDTFDILAAVDRSDVVVIEVNEAFVHRAGYGFIDRAIKALKPAH
jgi:hypothetical protein